MITYKFSSPLAHQHLLDIEVHIHGIKEPNEFILQLPSWRPGRYELGNFAKNIQKFRITNAKGKALEYQKTAKDCWTVFTSGESSIIVSYTYYAAELNAGSTYVDSNQIYVNPVNCCMYNPARIHEEISLALDVPDNYQIACSMKKEGKHVLSGKNFDELADSPLIASPGLQHMTFTAESGLPVHIWMQGECKPNSERILADFAKYTNWQIDLFKKCPANEYHYLIQILPVLFYHGVEHTSSTVLALGPGYGLNDTRYDELLGVACHEFYHIWNIKTIRPAEMWPYDYTKENYFPTGFVAEGVTTYMGDYLLWQSGVWSTDDYFREFNGQLQKHFDNFGRFNYSVVQSGFDNWLDGYVPGVPDRKVSIYVEGCLIAFMTDVLIMKYTNMQKNIHDVMRTLYNNFYLKNKGYTYEDYVGVVSAHAGKDMSGFFGRYAKGTENFRPQLNECLDWMGLEIRDVLTGHLCETHFGYKIAEHEHKATVTAIHPNSPAAYYELAINDNILAVNGHALHHDAHRWINYFGLFPQELTVQRGMQVIQLNIKPDGKEYYKHYKLHKLENANKNQEKMFECWRTKK
jgi:predicted metalloprotease with PDZ domain